MLSKCVLENIQYVTAAYFILKPYHLALKQLDKTLQLPLTPRIPLLHQSSFIIDPILFPIILASCDKFFPILH